MASANVRQAHNYITRRMWAIDGWLSRLDAELIVAISSSQNIAAISGNLLEIGVYRGKTAILLGHLARASEAFHVCDIFEEASSDSTFSAEIYTGLQQSQFEANYLRHHSALPIIHCVPSNQMSELISGTFRLVHVDGSHLYEGVRSDLVLAKQLLTAGGVVVADDFRSLHTPGVSAAVWESITLGALDLVAVTNSKAYLCVPGDAAGRLVIENAIATSPTLCARGMFSVRQTQGVVAVVGPAQRIRFLLTFTTVTGLILRLVRLIGSRFLPARS